MRNLMVFTLQRPQSGHHDKNTYTIFKTRIHNLPNTHTQIHTLMHTHNLSNTHTQPHTSTNILFYTLCVQMCVCVCVTYKQGHTHTLQRQHFVIRHRNMTMQVFETLPHLTAPDDQSVHRPTHICSDSHYTTVYSEYTRSHCHNNTGCDSAVLH